jgi:hypothetical protein
LDIIKNNSHKPWGYYGINLNPNITWGTVLANPYLTWDYELLSTNSMSSKPEFEQLNYILK